MGYKKYVEDYAKEYTIKPNGKPGMIAVYKGRYYRYVSEGEALRRGKILLDSLGACAFLFTLIPLLYKSAGADAIYVALPHVISLLPIVHLLLGLYSFSFNPEVMVREQRDKGESRVINSSVASLCCLGITFVAEAVNVFISGLSLPDGIYLLSLGIAIGSVLALFLQRGELLTEECKKNGERITRSESNKLSDTTEKEQ